MSPFSDQKTSAQEDSLVLFKVTLSNLGGKFWGSAFELVHYSSWHQSPTWSPSHWPLWFLVSWVIEQPSLNSPLKSFPGLSLHRACRILPALCHMCVLFRFHDSYGYGLLPHPLKQHFYLLLLGGVRPKPNEGQKGNFKHCLLALIHIQVILNNFFLCVYNHNVHRMSFS